MSDRTSLFKIPTGVDGLDVELFMDGQSGTWRLFFHPSLECVDFKLEAMRNFTNQLLMVLADIDEKPDEYNAELRLQWNNQSDPWDLP